MAVLYVLFIILIGLLLLYAGKATHKKSVFSPVLFIVGLGVTGYGIGLFFSYFFHL
ncbi:hypothetical protein [Priestia taiwanensis]|uniref:Uncharacterized protein n=1 Tax=Priestia taiwanensis TaxID=1347902 RepID=A0A917ELB8_9BACI|nr:hypothetical protein [Priestia taiwanensis]MBM7361936.1 ABC-type multidrug transport system permease subunit [Priestia taiwanensis]GGE58153.1 hypothetical protein GCM10007140_05620 [Priestia taiwanensis]